jgi:hypothetical protein
MGEAKDEKVTNGMNSYSCLSVDHGGYYGKMIDLKLKDVGSPSADA